MRENGINAPIGEFNEIVSEFRNAFLESDGELDPGEDGIVTRVVASSWGRCSRAGLDPATSFSTALESRKRVRIHDEADELIAHIATVSNPPRTTAQGMFDIFFLNNNGRIVHYLPGTNNLLPEGFNAKGCLISEENCGTLCYTVEPHKFGSVHVMIGREHYLDCFGERATATAPLYDAFENVIGSIIIVADESDANMKTLRMREVLFLLVDAYVRSVRQLTRADRATLRLDIWKSMFLSIQAYAESALITINPSGRILDANGAARSLLKLQAGELPDMSFYKYIQHDRNLVTRISQGNAVSDYRMELRLPEPCKCTFNSRPIISDNFTNLQGSLIKIVMRDEKGDPLPTKPIVEHSRTFHSIISDDAVMREVKNKAILFSSDATSVVLVGEVGTGKDMFAEAIHNQRNRNEAAPFVAVNCAALHTTSVQEKLFGMQNGDTVIHGRFEAANGGTLLLDNTDDLPLNLQTLFLRVLDERAVTRTGGETQNPVDFKLICTSRHELSDMVHAGKFRDDLYYRISDVIIRIPPLRKRVNDIGRIASSFVFNYCHENSMPPISLTERAIRALRAYEWPGNVRELKSAMNYACHTCEKQAIDVKDLPSEIMSAFSATGRVQTDSSEVVSLADIEREKIIGTLQETGGNVAKTAKLLGMGRSTLYKRLKRYEIPY